MGRKNASVDGALASTSGKVYFFYKCTLDRLNYSEAPNSEQPKSELSPVQISDSFLSFETKLRGTQKTELA